MPISYILFKVMKLLKEHNKKTSISKGMLSRVIGEFLIESFLPDEVKQSLLADFDFDYDIEIILDNYAGYISNEDGMITLSPYAKIEVIDSLINESSMECDEELISIIDDFYDFNIPVLEMIGIKMEEDLYKRAIELEGNIETGYENLAFSEMCGNKEQDSTLNSLKKNIIKRRILFNQLKNSMSLEEYNDLYRYSIKKADLSGIDTLELKIENDEMDLIMETDPFHRALFFIDSGKELIFSESFYASNRFKGDEEKAKETFYMEVIDVINGRTNKNEYDDIDEDLIHAKYRLMYLLDMLYQDEVNYNGYIFLGDRRNNSNFIEDYSFMEEEIFYLIDEVFEYNDKQLANNIDFDYNNTIKAILIETYYRLTKDERVVEAIKNHPNYSKQYYHFTAGLFDNIINNGKKKIKKKEDE